MISLNESRRENERSYMMPWVCVHMDSGSSFSRPFRQSLCTDPSSSACFNIQSTLQTSGCRCVPARPSDVSSERKDDNGLRIYSKTSICFI